jgi:hypothetical protein
MGGNSKDIIDHKKIDQLNRAIDQTNQKIDQIINKKSNNHKMKRQTLIIVKITTFTLIVFLYLNFWHNELNDKTILEFLSVIGFFTLFFLVVLK